MSRSPAGLWCRHRDASGRESGSELIKSGRTGGHAFTRGGTRSLFRTPGPCRPRLVLVDGPLQAIALAALKPHAHHNTTFAAPGGSWSRAADQALTALVTADPLRETILAFASLRDGSCPSRGRVQALLRDILPAGACDPLVLEPPSGGWVAALFEARTTARRAA
ncbi:hypothetical protein VQH23_19700 [Pararoseomonas sp. SCSIO 73927]|uniref:hypothetical protein n=1 Tax=Pararoseomonas sp. SCSIO 73927 TaxID=3114537 RepID=UPI0030D1A7F4